MQSRLIHIIHFIIFIVISTAVQGQSRKSSDVLIMKDGSIIKGQIISQDEYTLEIIDLRGDTLDYSFKYIDKVSSTRELDLDPYQKKKFHKTSGRFTTLSYALPPAIEIGLRHNEKLNYGLHLSLPVLNRDGFTTGSRTNIVGIAPYFKCFLSEDLNKARVFIDGWAGIIVDQAAPENENNLKGYLGFNVGVHLATRKKVRFFWRGGIYLYNRAIETVIRQPTVRVINENSINALPSITLVGIEF